MHFSCHVPPCVIKITPCVVVCLLEFFEIHKILSFIKRIAVCLSIGRKERSLVEKKGCHVYFSFTVPPCDMTITPCVVCVAPDRAVRISKIAVCAMCLLVL